MTFDVTQSLSQVILIVDNPTHSDIRAELEDWHGHVRVRVLPTNQGASAARNRGLDESTADWVVFLDDDVEPHADVVKEYCQAIAQSGHTAAGFVGSSSFPSPPNARCRGVQASHLTYFWNVADSCGALQPAPWAVTANVAVRRTAARFDPFYPKTGGGEDIGKRPLTGDPLVPACACVFVQNH